MCCYFWHYVAGIICFMQQMLYSSVSETAPDTQCMRSWAEPIANVDTVERREISDKIFSLFS